ncbi:MAG: hypothetical protein MI975_03550 [Cytophagales bacterium]|nr:hypothetical protein [Cytophagales bacterium]
MTKDELIDKILSDLYVNSNRGMDFYDDFSVYENDINKLEAAKTTMEKEGLIVNHKNLKTGISPLGFKICFEGGYMDEKNRRARNIKRTLQRNKMEITYLKKALRSKNQTNTLLLIFLIVSLTAIILMILGILNPGIK